MKYASSELTTKYLRSRKIPSTACSGCGLGMNHKIVVQAIQELGLKVEDIVWGPRSAAQGGKPLPPGKGMDSQAPTVGFTRLPEGSASHFLRKSISSLLWATGMPLESV